MDELEKQSYLSIVYSDINDQLL